MCLFLSLFSSPITPSHISFWASLIAQLVKNPPATQETPNSIPVLGRSPGEGNDYPLQYSGLGNSLDCILHGFTKSRTPLSNFQFHFHISFCKTVVSYRSFPGGASGQESTFQCRRHQRRGFDPWVGKTPWRRTWQSTPVLLLGESHGQRSLVNHSP